MAGLSAREFWIEASQWGSFTNNGDPGACMYGFDEKGMVQDQAHRQACINYIKEHCRNAADANLAAGCDPAEQHPRLDMMLDYLKNAPSMELANSNRFLAAYIEAALFSSNDDDGDPLDNRFSRTDLSKSTLEDMTRDCEKFQNAYGHFFTSEHCSNRSCPIEDYAGHDLWLTRNGHGTGFWDRSWSEPAASVLTKAAQELGDYELEVGDDGMLYGPQTRLLTTPGRSL